MGHRETELGAAGERLVAGLAAVAFRGQVSPVSMSEEASKRDLRLTFLDPQGDIPRTAASSDQSRHDLALQVKTGDSWAEWTKTKNRWRVDNIPSETIDTWKRSSPPTLLCWVPESAAEARVYCRLVEPGCRASTLSLRKWHQLTPATRYIVSETLHRLHSTPRNIAVTCPDCLPLTKERPQAREVYKALRGEHRNPVMGRVVVTDAAWRHFTRERRSAKKVYESLRTIYALKSILRMVPTRIQVLSCTLSYGPRVVSSSRLLLARYAGIHFAPESARFNVFMRLVEQVRFPVDWAQTLDLWSGDRVLRTLKLESVYRKRCQ